MTTTITVHGVLAGAYRGKDIGERALLNHASADGGETALCRKVKAGSLCDEIEAGPPTCPDCAREAAHMTNSKVGGRRAGAGRKPDRGAPRSEWIPIRATEADKTELVAAAKVSGQSLGEYLIAAGLERARRIALVALVALASGCTPGMHRAYQNSMGGIALAGWGTAAVITDRALSNPMGPFVEERPTFGMGPRAQVITFSLINLAVVAAIRFMPDRFFDEETPWIKDIMLTTAAAVGGFDAYNDYLLTR